MLASDLESHVAPDGTVDRHAVARAMADRLYDLSKLVSEDARDGLVAFIEAKLPDPLIEGATVAVNGYAVVLDRRYDNSTLTTDYGYQAIGGKDGLGGGSARVHTVAAGDTLRGLAAAYYGAPSYWYLIADANGLDPNDELKAGTTLHIPNVVTNSVNDKDTYKIYSDNEIIGTDSPVVRVKQKKKSWFQKLIQIVIVIIIVIAAVYVAAFAAGMMSAAMGTAAAAGSGFMGAMGAGAAFATSTGLAAAGVVATAVAAAAVGYVAGLATSFATQGLAIMTGLQDSFDWKGMRDMGSSFAISALAGAAGQWAGQYFKGDVIKESLARAAIQAESQQLRDGEITNTSGILMALVPAMGAMAAENSWIRNTADFAMKYKDTVAAGLSVIEASVRGDSQTLAWANFASSAIGSPISGGYYGADGYDWNRIAGEGLIAAGLSMIVANRFGEDAGLNFFGNTFGNTVVGAMGGKYAWDKTPEALSKLNLDPAVQAAIAGSPALREQFATELQKGGSTDVLGAKASGIFTTAVTSALDGLGLSAAQQKQVLSDPGKLAEAARIGAANLDPLARAMAVSMLLQSGDSAQSALGQRTMLAQNGYAGVGTQTDAIAAGTKAPSEIYTIKKGDSFWRIAAQQLGEGASDAAIRQRTLELMEANQGLDPRRLKIGSEINLPGAGTVVSDATLGAYNASNASYQQDLAATTSGGSDLDKFRAAVALYEGHGSGLIDGSPIDRARVRALDGIAQVKAHAQYDRQYGYAEMRAAPEPGMLDRLKDIWDDPYLPRIEKIRSGLQAVLTPALYEAERQHVPLEAKAFATGALKEVYNTAAALSGSMPGFMPFRLAGYEMPQLELSDAELRGAGTVQFLSLFAGATSVEARGAVAVERGVARYADNLVPDSVRATGAYLEGAEGGAGLGRLAERTVNVSDKGISIVEGHLKQFGDIPENQMMIERLRAAAAEGRPISGADASFYLHEISESTKMGRGLSYDLAHAEALQKYNVSPYSVYHPDVITTVNRIEPGSFNQNWLKFWGIEK